MVGIQKVQIYCHNGSIQKNLHGICVIQVTSNYRSAKR
jgi:hypothetical protein